MPSGPLAIALSTTIKMTPITPQSSQSDVFITPREYRHTSIQPSSPFSESFSDSDISANNVVRNPSAGKQAVDNVVRNPSASEQAVDDLNAYLSWVSSPPTTGPEGTSLLFPTREAVKDHIQCFAGPEGWTVKASTPKKDKHGEYFAQYFRCSKGGSRCNTKVPTPQRKRPKSRSGWCDCPWRAVSTRGEDGWSLRVTIDQHKRHPKLSIIAQASQRRYARNAQPGVVKLIQDNFTGDTTATKTLDLLRKQFPDVPVDLQDIYNEVNRFRSISDHGLPAINGMIKDLGKKYLYHYSTDSNDRLINLIFFHKESVNILQRYHNTIVLDCTYKTNRFNMYLLDIVGVTATGHSFVIGQAFLSGEATEDYAFVLQWLRDLYTNAGLGLPLSVTTDQAGGLLKALGEVFPEVPHLLCIWHINKRVKAWVQQHWLNEIVGNTVIQGEAEQTTPEQRAEYIAAKQERFWPLWCAIWSNARTETDVEAAWQKLCGIYRAEYPKIISYLDTTWMKHRKLFCRFWTDQITHFNNDASNRAEGCHQAVKKDLPTNMLHLQDVMKTLDLYLDRLNTKVVSLIEKDLHRPERQHTKNYMFVKLTYRISAYAINKLLGHLKLFKETHTSALPPCTGRFTKVWGIPCAHKYYETKERGDRLEARDFHQQWSIKRPDTPLINPILMLRDPVKIRDRPGKRQLSFFEHVDQAVTTVSTRKTPKKKNLVQGKVTEFFKEREASKDEDKEIASDEGTAIIPFTLRDSPQKSPKKKTYFRLEDSIKRTATVNEVITHLGTFSMLIQFIPASDYLEPTDPGQCVIGTASTGEYNGDHLSYKYRENDEPLTEEDIDWDHNEASTELITRTFIPSSGLTNDERKWLFHIYANFQAQTARIEYWKTYHGTTPLQWEQQEREQGRGIEDMMKLVPQPILRRLRYDPCKARDKDEVQRLIASREACQREKREELVYSASPRTDRAQLVRFRSQNDFMKDIELREQLGIYKSKTEPSEPPTTVDLTIEPSTIDLTVEEQQEQQEEREIRPSLKRKDKEKEEVVARPTRSKRRRVRIDDGSEVY
jgi:hypothetical protein